MGSRLLFLGSGVADDGCEDGDELGGFAGEVCEA